MSAEFGVYVHIPFCASKCDYCAFATWTDRGHLVERYLDGVRREIERDRRTGLPAASSVFIGGGTPSLVPPAGIGALITAIERTADAEVTVECNPDDVDAELVEAYGAAGVNRISLGVQSMVPHVLTALGRRHDPDAVERAVELITAVGIPTFNLDIIYGAAGESLADWEHTLHRVIALGPPHISAYALTVEAGTALADDRSRHPDDDDQADKYELADELLGTAGLVNYEVSNWATPGHRCRHNLLYWNAGEYRGFGCAAHSHRAGRRWWNLRTPERYLAAVERGDDTEASGEDLDMRTARLERLQLALRTSAGVPVDALTPEAVPALIHAGLIEQHGERWYLTRRGRLMANAVSMHLVESTEGSVDTPVETSVDGVRS